LSDTTSWQAVMALTIDRSPYLVPVPGPPILETWSENFVEIGHFQRNFDKVFPQRSTTKLGTSLLGQALSVHRNRVHQSSGPVLSCHPIVLRGQMAAHAFVS